MKFLCTIFLVLSIAPAIFCSDVLEFTDADFSSRIKTFDTILVEFFAPWCGHCKKLAPEYEKAATALKKHELFIAKVDCTVEKQTCEKFGVSGYPTLKVFKNGEFSADYNSERTADGIIKYMISKSGPSARNIKTLEEAEKYIDKSEDTIVTGFFDSEDSEVLKALTTAANSLNEDFRFYYSTTKDVVSKYANKNKINLMYPKKLFSKFEEKIKSYDGPINQGSIKQWIEDNAMGLCGVRTSSTVKLFNQKPIVIAYYGVDYEKDPKGTNYYRNRIMKVGKKFLDSGKKLSLAVSNANEMSYELNEFGVDSPDAKMVYITARNEKDQKFKMDKDFSMETFEAFLNDLFADKLTPYLKSEAVPDNSGLSVKVVVAKNFDEIVNDPTKDVLIEFYAPWCGHCKTLAPKYEELAEKMIAEKDIVIAKMDATANDVPSTYDVKGFPTIYFAPKNNKKSPLSYQGGREVDDFIKYLAAQSTDELSGVDRNGKAKKTDL